MHTERIITYVRMRLCSRARILLPLRRFSQILSASRMRNSRPTRQTRSSPSPLLSSPLLHSILSSLGDVRCELGANERAKSALAAVVVVVFVVFVVWRDRMTRLRVGLVALAAAAATAFVLVAVVRSSDASPVSSASVRLMPNAAQTPLANFARSRAAAAA